MADETTITLVSPIKRFPGQVILPHPDYVSGEQYNQIRMAHERRGKEKADLNHTAVQKMAYIGAEFVADYGVWGIDGLDIAEFRSWDTQPENEPFRFVTWFGTAFSDWVNELLDPKG
jgi:hypothetical protein